MRKSSALVAALFAALIALLAACSNGTDDDGVRPNTPAWMRLSAGLHVYWINDYICPTAALARLEKPADLKACKTFESGWQTATILELAARPNDVAASYPAWSVRIALPESKTSGWVTNAEFLRAIVPAGTDLRCDGANSYPAAKTIAIFTASGKRLDVPTPFAMHVLGSAITDHHLWYRARVTEGTYADVEGFAKDVTSDCQIVPGNVRVKLRAPSPVADSNTYRARPV